jgi:hypothetical protein
MLTKTLYVLQEYKDIQDNPWAQNKQDAWNKHTSKAAVIPYTYIRMIWVHCNKMESIPGGKSIVDLLSQLWEYVLKVVHKRNNWLPQEWRGNWCRHCRNSSWLSRLAWCKRSRLSLQYGDTFWPQTILVSNLVASFTLVAIPDILCYSSLCLRTPIPHRSVCPLHFALLTGYRSATRHKRRRSTCEILGTFTQNNSHDQHVGIFLKPLLYVYMLL